MTKQYTLSDDLVDEITVDTLIKHYKSNAESLKGLVSQQDCLDVKDNLLLQAHLTRVIEYFTTAETRKEKGLNF